MIETIAETLIAATCITSQCQTSYEVKTSVTSYSPAVTTYTVITPVGPNGMIYRRDRVGRLPQLRLLQNARCAGGKCK